MCAWSECECGIIHEEGNPRPRCAVAAELNALRRVVAKLFYELDATNTAEQAGCSATYADEWLGYLRPDDLRCAGKPAEAAAVDAAILLGAS